MFGFGSNWKNFAANALTASDIEVADRALGELLGESVEGREVLDVGFGQGLVLCLLAKKGAATLGIDIDPLCQEALKITAAKVGVEPPRTVIGSILDTKFLGSALGDKKFDVVHSWGVLHHTGSMWEAIDRASTLVGKRGKLIIALYNRHWSSTAWWWIKWFYNHSPNLIKKCMIMGLYPVIYSAKFLVTGRNPMRKERGMNFYYDVIDWIGGFPYEYASTDEVTRFLEARGFSVTQVRHASVPTGCNEFVFVRK